MDENPQRRAQLSVIGQISLLYFAMVTVYYGNAWPPKVSFPDRHICLCWPVSRSNCNLIILSLRKKIATGRKRKDSLSASLVKANQVTNDERSQSRVWGRHSPTSIWPKAQKTRKRIFVTQVDTCSLHFRSLHFRALYSCINQIRLTLAFLSADLKTADCWNCSVSHV